jgi:predicted nucleotidyltransferase
MTRDEILDQIVEWWLSRSKVDNDSDTIRFNRDNTRVTTIRLSQKMFIDATALAKSNNTTLNKLIEHLLFESLGMSNEYLKSTQSSQFLDLPEKEDE